MVRSKLSSPKMSFTLMDSLPFPRPDLAEPWVQRVAPIVLRLVCPALEMTAYWNAMAAIGLCAAVPEWSVPPDVLIDESARRSARAELDAIVARDVYGLTRHEMISILDTFPTAARYERQKYGAFVSRELILEKMT